MKSSNVGERWREQFQELFGQFMHPKSEYKEIIPFVEKLLEAQLDEVDKEVERMEQIMDDRNGFGQGYNRAIRDLVNFLQSKRGSK